MDTCFLCGNVMIPTVPPVCKNTSLRRAYEALEWAKARNQSARVADYDVQLFALQKICLLKERYNPAQPKFSLTNSIETAVVQTCTKYGLCPSIWTFVEYANDGEHRNAYHEYDLIVLAPDNVEWKYLWHSDCRTEKEPYSEALLLRRIEQYRSGANTVF